MTSSCCCSRDSSTSSTTSAGHGAPSPKLLLTTQCKPVKSFVSFDILILSVFPSSSSPVTGSVYVSLAFSHQKVRSEGKPAAWHTSTTSSASIVKLTEHSGL